MDPPPNHVVPEQLPDENYIERLFPKCPPKQAIFFGDKARSSSYRSKGNTTTTSQRKQTRSKVHQHSRRELEARRGNAKKAFNKNTNSSESSDENNNKNGGRSGMRKSVDPNKQSSGDLQNLVNKSPLGFAPRKTSKYTASQSLLQQLQRSQSSYNNNNNNINNNNNGNTSLESNQNDSNNKDSLSIDRGRKTSSPSGQERSVSGIVKSTSSFAFFNESSTSSSNNVVASPKYQPPPQQTSSHQLVSKSYQVNKPSADGLKNDNTQSDLLDNQYGANPEISGSRSILRVSTRKDATSNQPMSYHNPAASFNETPTPNANDNHTRRIPNDKSSRLINNYNNINNLVGNRRNVNRDKILDENLKFSSSESIMVTESSPLCATAIPSSSAMPIQTADLDFSEKTTTIDIGKKEPELVVASTDLISIAGPNNNSNHRHHLNQTNSSDKLANLDDFIIKKQQDSHNTPNLDTNRKDEDKYINLFVYDNATNHLPRISSPTDSHHNQVSRQDLEITTTTPNIIAIHHQVSQQLLTTDSNDNDDNVVRNDASTEELCSSTAISDNLDEVRKYNDISSGGKNNNSNNKTQQNPPEIPFVKSRSDSETPSQSIKNTNKTLSHRAPQLNIGTLQTVDEKAEINIVDEFKIENNQNQSSDKIIELERIDDTMPADQSPNIIKKDIVPPGFPLRIRPEMGPGDTLSQVSGFTPTNKEVKLSIISPSEKLMNSNSDLLNNQEISNFRVSKVENQRVKFDDENLVSVGDDDDQSSRSNQSQSSTNDKLHGIAVQATNRRNEHPPQMPSISEAQFESEIEPPRNGAMCEQPPPPPSSPSERDLSISLNKISITNSYSQEDRCDVGYRTNDSSSENFQQPSQSPREKNHSNFYSIGTESQLTNIDQQSTHGLDSKSHGLLVETNLTSNLRHHKLPNETSHYSMVRASGSNFTTTGNLDISTVLPRSSCLQFNTLSDGESGPDETTGSGVRQSGPNRVDHYTNMAKKCDSTSPIVSVTNQRNIVSTSSSIKNDDDMMPTTKTALIFPRLDEGLSSEAESCDDEVEDDDEKAMDADVDADDDEDDDDEVEDDNDTTSVDRSAQALQLDQSSVDSFLRQQQQQPKPQNRLLVGSMQQQQGSSIVNMGPTEQPDIHQVKAPGSTYGGYINQDPLDHTDLKSMTNYSNQNGQSNFWMGVSSHQPNLSSQPSSSQQLNQTRNHNTNNNNSPMSKNNNNSFNRDEAKATNRLSSDTDNETDRLLGSQRNDQLKLTNNDVNSNNSTDLQPISNVMKQNFTNSREVLIEGVLFNVKYLGTTHSDCEGRSEKEDRIHQAEMAVHEVKFRNGEPQSAIEVQLFISTEKIMVLDDKHRKIMMDHSLRTISYIADIGDAIVLIVRKKNSTSDSTNEMGRPVSKISCHVFESIESHTITKSISQAFQVAYTELLKANGTGDTSSYLPKELDYQEVLNSQEMSTDELEMFARKENQREVIVPKNKGEILGLSIVESGWGSVLPTVVIANLKHDGPAYRCKRLSIGDQILSVNGISLVGLPLADCQEILRKTKNQRVARLSVVPCPITVEVKIKRPDTKYQLGFSVQNGVICSLLRGGIAERGGVRVGHRIMSINGTTVVGVPHEKIVTLLASSVGEIRMKTCLTSLYKLILGEENPVHF